MLSISSSRLTLRPLTLADYERWTEGFRNRKRPSREYDVGPMTRAMTTREAYKARLARYRSCARRDELYVFGVFLRRSGEHVGTIDIRTLARQDVQWANIGYAIHNQHQSNGYGEEALVLGLRLGHSQLKYHRIEAVINLDNTISIKTARAAGMQREGIRRKFYREGGRWIDHVVYVSIAK